MNVFRGRRRLSGLLAAAAGPPRPGELDGEETAVAAYRAARPVPAHRARGRSLPRTLVANLASAKVVAACAAAAAAGAGGIVAATVGGLPNLFRASPAAAASSAPPVRTRPSAAAADRPLALPSSLAVLQDHASRCREWASRDREERQRTLDEPRFRDLINRAGRDTEAVDRYCRNLLNGASSGAPTARPSIWPTDRPDRGPGSRPPRTPRDR